MADVTGIIGSTTAAPAARAPAPASSQANAQTESLAVKTQVRPLSPSLKFDPVAGVMITEYLDSSGKIESQIPSAASVAYLRVGLTANGQQPEQTDVEKSVQTETTV